MVVPFFPSTLTNYDFFLSASLFGRPIPKCMKESFFCKTFFLIHREYKISQETNFHYHPIKIVASRTDIDFCGKNVLLLKIYIFTIFILVLHLLHVLS